MVETPPRPPGKPGPPEGIRRAHVGLLVEERRRKVAQLLRAGASLRQIGKELGISPTQAKRDKDAYLRRMEAEGLSDMRAVHTLEVDRLDALVRAAWPLLQHTDPDIRLKAIGALLRINERRADMLGLEPPKRLEVKTDGLPFAIDPAQVTQKTLDRALVEMEKIETKLLTAGAIQEAEPEALPSPDREAVAAVDGGG